MCGIAGFYNRDSQPADPVEMIRMSEAIHHRGPDDNGVVLFSLNSKKYRDINERSVKDTFEGAVAHNRLSILDLSSKGRQPMININKDIIIAYNGEVYNAFDYRDLLISLGYRLKSRTDTEIILYLYEHFGLEKMLSKLNGMFAICIVDLRVQKIILVRDRMGIKPLYYYINNDVVMFSSEIKAFLFHKRFISQLDHSNLDEHIKFGYVYGKENLLKNVYDVMPGEYIEISKTGIFNKKYWEVPNEDDTTEISYKDAIKLVEKELVQSTRLRLLSDVKIGCQLSGGIDSSLITLYASKLLKDYDLHTFSIIHENKKFSEEPYIDFVNSKVKVINHKILMTSDYIRENISKALWHFDFPTTHASYLGILRFSKEAKKYFSVFLSGEGADELFGGYERFYGGNVLTSRLNYHLIKCNPLLRHHISQRYFSPSKNKFDLVDWYITTSNYGSLKELRKVKQDFSFEKFMTNRRACFNSGQGDFVRKAQRYELNTWLISCLVRQDKMTMAHSIENRVPMLDHHLVDLARKLPTKYLVRMWPPVNISTKRILKHIAARYFNRKFAYRNKIGFTFPVKDLFKEKAWNDWIKESIIPSIKSRGIYNYKLMEQYNANAANLDIAQINLMWNFLNFEIWAKLFLDRNPR